MPSDLSYCDTLLNVIYQINNHLTAATSCHCIMHHHVGFIKLVIALINAYGIDVMDCSSKQYRMTPFLDQIYLCVKNSYFYRYGARDFI